MAGNIPVASLVRLCLVIFLIIFLVGKMSGGEIQPAIGETQDGVNEFINGNESCVPVNFPGDDR